MTAFLNTPILLALAAGVTVFLLWAILGLIARFVFFWLGKRWLGWATVLIQTLGAVAALLLVADRAGVDVALGALALLATLLIGAAWRARRFRLHPEPESALLVQGDGDPQPSTRLDPSLVSAPIHSSPGADISEEHPDRITGAEPVEPKPVTEQVTPQPAPVHPTHVTISKPVSPLKSRPRLGKVSIRDLK